MDQHYNEDGGNEREDARIAEAVNEATKPLQEQLAAMAQMMREMMQRPVDVLPANTLPQLEVPPIDTFTPGVLTPGTERERSPAPQRHKPLPNPKPFNGKRSEYASWAQQMRDKVRLDGWLYPNTDHIWYLINSCLEPPVQKVVATFYKAGGATGRRDPGEFMTYLDRIYEDQNQEAKAAASLRRLRQGETKSFAAFLPRFEQLLVESGGAEWADKAKITFLEGALNTRLTQGLAYIRLPKDYFGWLEAVQEMAGKLEQVDRRPASERPARQPTRDAEGDVRMGGVSRAAAPRRRRRSADRDASSEEEQRRCYRCGERGHLARNCEAEKPNPKAGRKPRAARSRAKEESPHIKQPAKERPAVGEAESSGETTPSDDSGNE